MSSFLHIPVFAAIALGLVSLHLDWQFLGGCSLLPSRLRPRLAPWLPGRSAPRISRWRCSEAFQVQEIDPRSLWSWHNPVLTLSQPFRGQTRWENNREDFLVLFVFGKAEVQPPSFNLIISEKMFPRCSGVLLIKPRHQLLDGLQRCAISIKSRVSLLALLVTCVF